MLLRRGVTSTSTSTSRLRLCPDSSHSMRLLLPGFLAVTTSSAGEVTTDSITSGLPVRMRLIRPGVCTNKECPTMMCTVSGLIDGPPWAPCVPRDGAVAKAGAGGGAVVAGAEAAESAAGADAGAVCEEPADGGAGGGAASWAAAINVDRRKTVHTNSTAAVICDGNPLIPF